MAEGEEHKFTRETGEGFDIFRALPGNDDKSKAVYVRYDHAIRFEFDHYRLTASTLSQEGAKRAHTQSSDMVSLIRLGSENSELPEPVARPIDDINHADMWLSAPLMDLDVNFGLITLFGASAYEGQAELSVHIGLDEHSHLSHYERGEECVYLSAYISRERMEWLHRELISRPNALLVMTATISAFKAEGGWASEFSSRFGKARLVYLEPAKAVRLKDVSFDVCDPDIGKAKDRRSRLTAGLASAREKWVQTRCNPSPENCEPWEDRCARALAFTSERIAEWCAKNGETADAMVRRLTAASNFLEILDGSLHDKDGPFGDAKGAIWQHLNFQTFIRNTTPAQREAFVGLYNLGESIDEYIASPHLQNDYLDWLLLDVMAAQKTTALVEAFLTQKLGLAYAFVGNVWWKLWLWKLTLRPLGFVLGWVLPAVAFYFLALWSLWLGVGLGAVYYGVSLVLIARWLWYRLSSIITGSPTRRLRLQIEEMDSLYPLLAAPVLHVGTIRTAFERAAERGVIWDQRIFYILDHLAKRNPQPWSNGLRRIVG